MEEQTQHSEIYYDIAELSKLKYVKVAYKDIDDEIHEVSTEVKFIGNSLISLYFNQTQNFYAECPQDVILKFVTTDAMYIATAILTEAKKVNNVVYLSIVPPVKIIRQQNRKYTRVNIDRTCILVVDDAKGKSTTYMAKSVNLSASGILINNLKTIIYDEPFESDFSKYDCFHIIMCLESDMVIKQFARYVRHDYVNNSHRYAFHYMRTKPETVSMINKYAINEQIKQLKQMQNND